MEAAQRAVELGPDLGEAHAALREARCAREIQPEYGLTHFMEGVVLHHKGRLDEATS